MDQQEQHVWLTKHIPYRLRAAIARMDMTETLLRFSTKDTVIDPPNAEENFFWRCSTDAIWEGRLAAARWLIEFIGIKQKDGKPHSSCPPSSRFPNDVFITHFDGGKAFSLQTDDGHFLAKVWKGCSRASSHATKEDDSNPITDKVLAEAIKIILDHLQKTIYDHAGKRIQDCITL